MTGIREFYIPHKPVVRESAETTKLRVVYDVSARTHSGAPSLNECLNPGPPLQNQLWSVLVRARFHPLVIARDIKQVFLQVRIREDDRDALRFYWLKDLNSQTAEALRLTRALFGLTCSPFLLGGVVQHLLESCREKYPEIVREIEKSLYVDDLISGGPTRAKAESSQHLWRYLLKGHLSCTSGTQTLSEEVTYAKEQLGTSRKEGASLLGLPRNKDCDTISVNFPSESTEPTKQGILSKVAKTYDPLGLVSPTTLGGKFLSRDICDAKLAWDAKLPSNLIQSWVHWEKLPSHVTVPRSLAAHQVDIQAIELHAFGDASGKGVAVYTVVVQEKGVNQGLVASRATLAKKGLTIPRL